MKQKKILFVYGVYSIHAEKRIKIFLEDDRFDVSVISRHDYNIQGINCFKLIDYRDNVNFDNKPKWVRAFIYLKQLMYHLIFIKNVINTFKPNTIFLQTLLYPAFFLFFLKKKTPLVITFWNGDVTWWAKWDFLEKFFKYQIVKKGISVADYITVNSNLAKECCKKYYKNQDKIIVLPYPGVDRNIFQPSSNKNKLKIKLGIVSDYVFFCPRGLAIYLNNEQILKAFSSLKDHIQFTSIFIIGNSTPSEIHNFNFLIDKYKLKDYVKLIKHQNAHQMSELYSIADLTISISSNDSQPNSMLESMSCGTVVLMGDIPQIREWILDNDTGLLCEIGN